MADWYVSSTSFAAVPTWTASTVKAVGNLVRATAPASGKEYVFRCTTAGTTGTTEPTWSTAYINNNTKADGTVTWTNVSAQAAYGWAAAAGSLYSIGSANNVRPVIGDRVFVSSDHSESFSLATIVFALTAAGASFGLMQIISVNKAGSVPPAPADVLAGARVNWIGTSGSGFFEFDNWTSYYWQGITFTISAAGATATHFYFTNSSSNQKTSYFKDCAFIINSNFSNARFCCNTAAVNVVFDNTTVQFGHIGQWIGPQSQGAFHLTWLNTPNAVQGAIIPTALFNSNTAAASLMTCRGVDLSAINTTLFAAPSGLGHTKALLESCKIAPGVTRLGAPAGNTTTDFDEVELVNCWDGSNVVNERFTHAGVVTTDRTNVMSGGAADDVGAYSFKLASSSRSNLPTFPLNCFAFDAENTLIGAAKTATVEFVASATFNTDDIRLQLEYMSVSGNPVTSFVDTLTTILTSTALPASTTSWTVPPITTVFNSRDMSGAQLAINNLNVTTISGVPAGVRTLDSLNAGKNYWENTIAALVSSFPSIGICLATTNLVAGSFIGAAVMDRTGTIYVNNVNTTISLGARAVNDIIGVAADLTAGLIWFRVAPAGLWNNSGTADPATGVGGISLSSISPGPWYACVLSAGANSDSFTANFGAAAFSGVVPAGFNSGFPGATVKQKLQLSFTPQRAGRIRGLVRLGRSGMTAWVNPQMSIA